MSSSMAQEVCHAAASTGMQSDFGTKIASLGSHGKYASNIDRELLLFWRADLGINVEIYKCPCTVKSCTRATAKADLGILLPHELAHWMYTYSVDKFKQLFCVDRLHAFWVRTIARNETWFQLHPLKETIIATPDKSVFLAIQLFGDDGMVRKRSVYQTLTWNSALTTGFAALHCRFPTYIMPTGLQISGITEVELQAAVIWSFHMWHTRRFGFYSHLGEDWPANSQRSRMAGELIAGGYIPVYVGTTADMLWRKQHYRFPQHWQTTEICHRCEARDDDTALNFMTCTSFPQRSHEAYMKSEAAANSPLCNMIGFHISMCRSEPMHSGPLGALPSAVGSALIELCDSNFFGGADLTPWEFKISAQLSCAFKMFHTWSKENHETHDIKKFSRTGFSMYTMSYAWPSFKGRAHNCVTLCRWLAAVCLEVAHESEYSRLRASVLGAWCDFFCLSNHPSDPDFHTEPELKEFDKVCTLLLHGTKRLAYINACSVTPRWKTVPKMHEIQHIHEDVLNSHRPAKIFPSWLDEGKAAATLNTNLPSSTSTSRPTSAPARSWY